jgi:endonuclease-3
MKAAAILEHLHEMYPEARCELHHQNNYEMAVAVILSAQTTDASVNRVTPALFAAYPTVQDLAEARPEDIEPYIASLGLYHSKARAIQGFAEGVVERFGGEIPSGMKELTSLPGVGRKCANVIRAECFGIPSLAVDTHVARVSRRLKLAREEDSVEVIEQKLCRKFPRSEWIYAHHAMIFFGRYKCHARAPECADCPFAQDCRETNKNKTRD